MKEETINITPKNDIVFKKIFGSKGNEEILKDFLEAILKEKVENVRLDLETELLPEFVVEKTARLDVRADIGKETQVNIEIQINPKDFSPNRCLSYWSKLFLKSIGKGEPYGKGKKTISIWIVDGEIYEDFESYMSKWKVIEEQYGIKGKYENFEIDVIELKKFREVGIMNSDKIEQWLNFIDHTKKEMIEMACVGNDRVEEAMEQLRKIRADEGLMNAIISRELYEMDQASFRARERQEGLEEGMEKGLAKGKEEGKLEGKTESQREIAKKMKEKKIDIDTIVQITGLTREEIEKL